MRGRGCIIILIFYFFRMLETIQKHSKIALVVLLLLTNVFIWSVVWSSGNSQFQIYFLDVGQGDAILIKSPSGNKMLIDGGQSASALMLALSKAIPFYSKKIDVVLATHPDADHIGGLSEIFRRFEVDFVIDPDVLAETRIFRDFQNAVALSDSQKLIARRGMKIDLGGGVVFVVLFPDRDVSGLNPNDASIVGKLFFGDTSFLLAGDAPIKIEEYLNFLDNEFLESDVLKVGHHGSRTSTSNDFVTAVNPKYAIISAGRDNRYGHPHKEVIETLQNFQAKILGTYELGTILIKSDGKSIIVGR